MSKIKSDTIFEGSASFNKDATFNDGTSLRANGSSYTAGGTGDTITLTGLEGNAPTAYKEGHIYTFIAGATNTGATTVNVNGIGAKAVKSGGFANALTGGEIVSGRPYQVVYSSSDDSFELAEMGFNTSVETRIHASIAGIPYTELQINASTAGLDEVWDDVNTTVGTSASNLLTRVGALTGGVIEIEGTGTLESVGTSEEHTGYMHLTVDFDNMKVKGTAVGSGGSAWTNRAISETILAGSNTYSFIVVAGNYSTELSTITIDGTTKKITGIPKVPAINSSDHNSMYKITHKA